MLLAIDTSAGTTVAVVHGGAVLATRDSADTRGHAELVGTFIAESLREAGVAPADLDGVVAGMGPGPFTGLRVGIAAARAFALGARVPLLPVVSHDAIAFGRGEPTFVVTDARRRELFWSLYGEPDAAGLPVRREGPSLAKPEQLETPAGVTRVDAATLSAGRLGLLAEAMLEHGHAFAGTEALYLRSPDVTPSAGPKRVS